MYISNTTNIKKSSKTRSNLRHVIVNSSRTVLPRSLYVHGKSKTFFTITAEILDNPVPLGQPDSRTRQRRRHLESLTCRKISIFSLYFRKCRIRLLFIEKWTNLFTQIAVESTISRTERARSDTALVTP